MTAAVEIVTTSYSYERLCFDRWAAWCEGQWEQALGLPAETLLSRVSRFGIRVGVARAGNEPEIHDEPEIVSALMEEWVVAEPLSHRALMARHRRIIRGIKIAQLTDEQGKPKRFRDSDFALLILGSSSHSSRKAFQRLCTRGYVELRQRLRARHQQRMA